MQVLRVDMPETESNFVQLFCDYYSGNNERGAGYFKGIAEKRDKLHSEDTIVCSGYALPD